LFINDIQVDIKRLIGL